MVFLSILRWVHEYGDLIYQIWKKKNKKVLLSWYLDEIYIKVKGTWCYLYCAIDKEGQTLGVLLRKKRNKQAAYAFIKRFIQICGEPTVHTTDKAPSLASAFKKLRKIGFYKNNFHRTTKYLNNIIEQDHRNVKCHFTRSLGFQILHHASHTIYGLKTVHAIHKQRKSL